MGCCSLDSALRTSLPQGREAPQCLVPANTQLGLSGYQYLSLVPRQVLPCDKEGHFQVSACLSLLKASTAVGMGHPSQAPTLLSLL